MEVNLADRVARYYVALNALDLTAVEALFAPDAVYRSAGIGALEGRSVVMAAMTDYFAEFADQVATCDSLQQIGPDRIRTAWRLAATSSRSGRRSERSGIETITFTPDGLIRSIEVDDQ